jgi:2-amino-4-hydroxy-6-hydroxymethyldihydropteridine diphosphokinase
MNAWIPACIGVGSNLGDPIQHVSRALADIKGLEHTAFFIASNLYRNPPMGPQDQPDYVNAVAAVLTRLEPRELLLQLQQIEQRHGRDRSRSVRWGARHLDLDILTYGLREIDEPGLVIPHPGISERNFVLLPLLEITPQLHIPGSGPVRYLATKVDRSTLHKVSQCD